ncbi:MAG: flagellar motor switch protein FliN [Desulfuromonadaceae bacterium]|nr:flagellar motor switch protein FliN [Desulfuromonas sp.]MDY0185000.1 flagellar motor switch protein FliN [Desulfuromonadaceae bacterium]
MAENEQRPTQEQAPPVENENTAVKTVETGAENIKNLDLLLDIPLDVSVEVGRSRMLVRDLLQMDEGYVVELGKQANEPLDVYVNSRLIARGEVVLIDDKLGLRLTDVVSPAERIENLA